MDCPVEQRKRVKKYKLLTLSTKSIPTEEKNNIGRMNVMHWRLVLVIDWLLLITLEVTKITHEDPLFIFNLRKEYFAFIL